MTLQLGTIAQADLAMRFIEEAKAYLKAQGIDQWQTGYPDLPCIMQDLASGKGFFLQQEDGTHAGYVCIDFDGEPAYDSLCGTWLTGNGGRAYGVVHRLALSTRTRGQGLASAVFGILEDYVRAKGSRSLRMDTDDDNVIMKHLLSKHGYTCCGKIRFDNSDKIAYEKLL